MAFCDNPKCRWKDRNGVEVIYIKRSIPRLRTADTPIDLHAQICDHETITVKCHLYHDMWTEKPITRRFCDECVDIVEKAERRLEYLRRNYPKSYADYLNDHGDNLLIHFVQSEWFARENGNKKSQF